MDTVFLILDDVLELHEHQIEQYGGSQGIRDMNLLLSALETPKAMFGGQFLHEDVFEMAAAYLFHIVQNHAFIDGNKRAGLAAAIAFLGYNNIKIVAEPDDLTNMVLEVAQGRLGKPAIADFLRQHSREGS